MGRVKLTWNWRQETNTAGHSKDMLKWSPTMTRPSCHAQWMNSLMPWWMHWVMSHCYLLDALLQCFDSNMCMKKVQKETVIWSPHAHGPCCSSQAWAQLLNKSFRVLQANSALAPIWNEWICEGSFSLAECVFWPDAPQLSFLLVSR